MRKRKFHIIFDNRKPDCHELAETLMDDLGQTSLDEADTIITVGGDGTLLRALEKGIGKDIYALTPAGGESLGFWTDHGVTCGADLLEHIGEARPVTLYPLRAVISFANDNSKTVLAFSDVAVERSSGQRAYLDLSAAFGKEAGSTLRLQCDGVIFSTALGSTGATRSVSGPAMDITTHNIAILVKGGANPRGTSAAVINANGAVLKIVVDEENGKRPVRIDYDGLFVANDNGSPVASLEISYEHKSSAKLLVRTEPGIRAFNALMP